MNTEKSSTRGGARKGAGRKKKYVKRIFFSATQDVVDILSKAGDNQTDFINECIVKAAQSQETEVNI